MVESAGDFEISYFLAAFQKSAVIFLSALFDIKPQAIPCSYSLLRYLRLRAGRAPPSPIVLQPQTKRLENTHVQK